MGRWAAILTGLLALLAWPWMVDQYWLQVSIISGTFVILAVSLNLIQGVSGQISLAHAAFYGVGAYTSALLALRLQVSFWMALPVAVMATALLALAIAIPSLTLRGHYLAIVTLGFGEIIYQVLERWESMTHGVMGLKDIPPPTPLFGLVFDRKVSYYYLLLVLIGLTLFVVTRVVDSRVGRALKAIREDEFSAQALGVAAYRYKVTTFVLGSALAGLAGSFFAHYQRVLTPTEFTFLDSVRLLMMVIVGGMGSIAGSVLGALVLVWLPELLRTVGDYRDMVYGAACILIIVFLPGGLMALLQRARDVVAGSAKRLAPRAAETP
jgi:branched-chain amino acid transport system permease protein